MGTESPLALLLIALIPPLFFLVYIYRQDDIESEPRGMIAGIIGLGALSAIPAVILESISASTRWTPPGLAFWISARRSG